VRASNLRKCGVIVEGDHPVGGVEGGELGGVEIGELGAVEGGHLGGPVKGATDATRRDTGQVSCLPR
jgi:hypothetical protein